MEINYVDSRTDKERLKDEKVQRITTTTVPKNGKIVYIKLNNNHFRDVKKKVLR